MEERFWPARLRWRLRGATMWPAFVLLTLLDGLVLHLLPPVRTGVDPIPAVLLATFGNLVLVGVLAPWLARRIGTSRPAAATEAPPQASLEVLTDRVGTALLVTTVFGLLAAGLAARPNVIAETDAKEEAALAVHEYVRRSGDEELIRNEETAHAARLAEGYFRVCIARDDRRRFVCLLVDTTREPTQVVRDPSAKPNRRS